eukprot:m.10313 g.10313  ORF g.10313 m.10313 type:complete len:139 (+) comp6564_c0_seq1:467-883(+)
MDKEIGGTEGVEATTRTDATTTTSTTTLVMDINKAEDEAEAGAEAGAEAEVEAEAEVVMNDQVAIVGMKVIEEETAFSLGRTVDNNSNINERVHEVSLHQTCPSGTNSKETLANNTNTHPNNNSNSTTNHKVAQGVTE